MMINKSIRWALNLLLTAVVAPAIAQQTDGERSWCLPSRSNRTVAEMAQTTWSYQKRRAGTADSGRQKNKTHWLNGLALSAARSRTNCGI